MKTKFVRIGIIAAIAALVLCLAGCSSSSKGYVEINDEHIGLDKLPQLIEENPLSVQDEYIGKEITVVAPYDSYYGPVSGGIIGANGGVQSTFPYGEVILGNENYKYRIQLTEETRDLAASLKKGDIVKASGVFSGYSETGDVYLATYDGFEENRGSIPYDSIQPAFEIKEG